MSWRDGTRNGDSPIPVHELDRSYANDSDSGTEKQPRDWKRTTLILGLGTLSWVATYVGMLELIEANIGSLPLSYRAIIGFSVAMLMVMIIWLLDQMFRPQPLLTRTFYVMGYMFLTVISVGFGFGFYWKVFESRSEASRSAEMAVSHVQTSLAGANTRLTQLEATLKQLATVSAQKAELERTKGTSCPNSRPGDGPRRRMRDDDAQKFAFASELVGNRATTVRNGLGGLDGDLAKIAANDPSTIDPKTGTRNEFLRQLSRKLDMTTARFNGLKSDPQLRQLRSELADRSTQTTFPDGRGGTISCPDAQLQTALRGAVAAIDQLPQLETPEIAVVEGSEATIEAFRRLTATLAGVLTFKLPPSADELRKLQKEAVGRIEGGRPAPSVLEVHQGGLASRDYIPLGVAVFVDFCLFLVSLVQRPAGRLSGLMPKMQAAERGPVIDILSRFNEIHRDRQVRENFEIFRHVVFDMNGDYYAAIPLDAPTRLNPEQRETLRVEAQLLANLFASFEKEKIFKRTLLPTTGSIQKRLARQGSKFAGSEAFRVYKFADGAWSDIILGAVMGAARRLDRENTLRSRTASQGKSGLSAFHAAMTDGAKHATDEEPLINSRFKPNDNDTGSGFNPTDLPRFEASVMTAHNNSGLTTGAASGLGGKPSRYSSLPDQGMVLPFGGESQRDADIDASLDPEHVSRFGPYAKRYRPVPSPAPYAANAPQSPRVPRRQKSAADIEAELQADVVVHPQSQIESDDQPTRILDRDDARNADILKPAENDGVASADHDSRVSMTLRRETATFSVPVSEAVLPKSLSAALAAMSRHDDTKTDAIETQSFEVSEAAPIIPNEVPTIQASDEGNITRHDAPAEENANASDLHFLKRLAPPAAE